MTAMYRRGGSATWMTTSVSRRGKKRRGAGWLRNVASNAFGLFKRLVLPLLKTKAKQVLEVGKDYALSQGPSLVKAYMAEGVSGVKDKIAGDLPSLVSEAVLSDSQKRGSGQRMAVLDVVQQCMPQLRKHFVMLPTEVRPWQREHDMLLQNSSTQFPVQTLVDCALHSMCTRMPPQQLKAFIEDAVVHDVTEERGGAFGALIPIIGGLASSILPSIMDLIFKRGKGSGGIAQRLYAVPGGLCASRPTSSRNEYIPSSRGSGSRKRKLGVADFEGDTGEGVKVQVKELAKSSRGGRPKVRTVALSEAAYQQIFG